MPSEGEKSRSNSAPARLVSADASKIGASMDFFNAAKVGFFIIIIYRLCAAVFFVNFKLCFKVFKIRIKNFTIRLKNCFLIYSSVEPIFYQRGSICTNNLKREMNYVV